MRVKIDNKSYELRFLPVVVQASRLKKRAEYIVKSLQADERTLGELRRLKRELDRKSFEIFGCQVSEGKTSSKKEYSYPAWCEVLIYIADRIYKLVSRYRREIVVEDGAPYVKVAVPKQLTQTDLPVSKKLVNEFSALEVGNAAGDDVNFVHRRF